MREREFILMICVNLRKSTSMRTIRVTECQSSATRGIWQRNCADQSEVILLGSIATGKYVDVLLANFGQRLRFPADFVGRGDMSRGGLMLRCAADRQELSYLPVAGAIVNGKRPPKLAPRRYPTRCAPSAQCSAKGAFPC